MPRISRPADKLPEMVPNAARWSFPAGAETWPEMSPSARISTSPAADTTGFETLPSARIATPCWPWTSPLRLPSVLFRGMKTRVGATWMPRLLAATELLWGLLGQIRLTERFEQVRQAFRALERQVRKGKYVQRDAIRERAVQALCRSRVKKYFSFTAKQGKFRWTEDGAAVEE
jgi:hypothetical protein